MKDVTGVTRGHECVGPQNCPKVFIQDFSLIHTHFGMSEMENPLGSSGTMQIYVIHLHKCLQNHDPVLYSLYWVFWGGVQKKKSKKKRLWSLMYRFLLQLAFESYYH